MTMLDENGIVVKPYLADRKPINMYLGEEKMGGWHESTLLDVENAEFEITYNDTADITIKGETIQVSDYYAKDGLSSQVQETLTYADKVSDFVGKVSGSLVENPNISKYAIVSGASNLATPYDLAWVENGTLGYSQINTLNGVCHMHQSYVEVSIPQRLFSFNIIEIFERQYGTIPSDDQTVAGKVAWLKENVNELKCQWYGYGSCPSGNMAHIACYNNAWAIGAGTNTTNLVSIVSFTISQANMVIYIQSDGFVHFLAYTDASDGVTASTIYTDYISLTLKFKTVTTPNPLMKRDITSNLPAGTYKYTSTDGIYEFTLDDDIRGIDTSVDKVVFDRVSKRGYLERRNTKYISNGNDNWILLSGNIFYFIPSITMAKGKQFICSHYSVVLSRGTNKTMSYEDGSGICFWITDNSFANVTELKAWLSAQYNAGTPLTVVYQLKTPTRTPLTFTKVASSIKTEVPLTFLTSTPSLDYPSDVWDSSGNVVSRGKNLFDENLPPNLFGSNAFSGYGGSVYSIIENGYKLTKRWNAIGFNVILKPNVRYTISANVNFSDSTTGNRIAIGINKHINSNVSNSVAIDFLATNYNNSKVVFTFTSNPLFSKNIIAFATNSNDSTNVWTLDITNIQLEENTVATEFKPYHNTTSQLPTLRKVNTVSDEYNPKTGVLTKRISDWVTLDGYPLGNCTDISGENKQQVLLKFVTESLLSSIVLSYKYDSLQLSQDTADLFDTAYITASNYPVIRIANADSGWAKGNIPTLDERKAYFYGFKMCNADGTSPYYKSEVPYNPSTWAEWSKVAGIVGDSSGLEFTAINGSVLTSTILTSLKTSAKYGYLVNIVSNTLTGSCYFTGTPLISASIVNGTGNKKGIMTTYASFGTNHIKFELGTNNQTGEKIKVMSIRIFELPAGSQIESDFNTLTADQLSAKYTFNGLCEKNWKHVTDGLGQTNVLPVASYDGYTPYKMLYQLATPVEQQLTPTPVPTYYPTTIIETDCVNAIPKMDITVKVED